MRISCLRRAPKLATLHAIASRDQVPSQQSKLQHLYQQAQETFGCGKQPNSPEDLQAVTQALRESYEPLARFVQMDKELDIQKITCVEFVVGEIPLHELAMQAPVRLLLHTTTVFHNHTAPARHLSAGSPQTRCQ